MCPQSCVQVLVPGNWERGLCLETGPVGVTKELESSTHWMGGPPIQWLVPLREGGEEV